VRLIVGLPKANDLKRCRGGGTEEKARQSGKALQAGGGKGRSEDEKAQSPIGLGLGDSAERGGARGKILFEKARGRDARQKRSGEKVRTKGPFSHSCKTAGRKSRL